MRYKGMLNIQCKECGQVEQYFQPEWTEEHNCRECDNVTKMGKLKRVYINCECGNVIWYHTNITDKMFDIKCCQCDQPVAVEYDTKHKNYMTINRERKHGRR